MDLRNDGVGIQLSGRALTGFFGLFRDHTKEMRTLSDMCNAEALRVPATSALRWTFQAQRGR